nr:hypothetical protein [Tanacetum cinerariifolium]
MAQRTPTYPKTFEEPIPSRHPTSYPGTPHIATPMALQGFAPWSSTNQARLSQNPGTPHIAIPKAQQGFAPWSSTNQAGPSQNLMLVESIRMKCVEHINCWMELMIRARPPSVRYTVAKTGTSAMLDKSNKFVIETDVHLMGMLDGSSCPYPSWDDVDIINKAGHFERTGRRPYKFELFYNQGLDFVSSQQGNTSDCGVVTCWVIENLCRGQAPLLYQADPIEFFSAIRVQMCLRLYDCRCEDTLGMWI